MGKDKSAAFSQADAPSAELDSAAAAQKAFLSALKEAASRNGCSYSEALNYWRERVESWNSSLASPTVFKKAHAFEGVSASAIVEHFLGEIVRSRSEGLSWAWVAAQLKAATGKEFERNALSVMTARALEKRENKTNNKREGERQ